MIKKRFWHVVRHFISRRRRQLQQVKMGKPSPRIKPPKHLKQFARADGLDFRPSYSKSRWASPVLAPKRMFQVF